MLSAVFIAIIANSCQGDDIRLPGDYGEPDFSELLFPGYEETFGQKTITVEADGGNIQLPTGTTKDGQIIKIVRIFTGVTDNYTADGRYNNPIRSEEYDEIRCYSDNNWPTHNPDFDWCNPDKEKIFTFQWCGFNQKPDILNLFIQPNETAHNRKIYLDAGGPNYMGKFHGMLTIIQIGKKVD